MSNQLTKGTETYQQLEQEFAIFADKRFAIAVNTGTAALHLSLIALGIGPGDEVIVPDFTFAACAFAVSYTGATPIFVDCNDTLNIDPELIEGKITTRTKAIMPVHIYGRRCNMERVNEIAKRYGLFVVEDVSEAHGVTLGENTVACYSLQSTKIIHAEEGGMIVTDSKELYKKIQYLKNLSNDGTYFHKEIGFNYRMANSQAKLALQSLREFPINRERRMQIESWYQDRIPDQMPPRDVVWVYDTLIPWKGQRGARPFFKPLSSLPMYAQPVGKKAQFYSQFTLFPVTPEMTEGDVTNLTELKKIT